jgi:hypothetical protein
VTRQEVFLTAGSLTLFFLAGEAACRWLLPPQYRLKQSHQHGRSDMPVYVYDAEIGWVLSSNSVKVRDTPPSSSITRDVTYSVGHGQRLTASLPHSGPQIVTTGCSFTFGMHLDDEDSWPWLLQERLPDYHVVNVAANGYGTDQALLAAERQASRSPGEVRTVVLGFGDFQIERNRSPQSWLGMIYPFGKPLFVQNGANAEYKRLVKFWSFGSAIDRIADHSTVFSRAANLFYDRVIDRIEWHDGARKLTASLITDFGRRFQTRGINLVVVILPYLGDQSPQSKKDRNIIVAQLRGAGISTLVLDFPRLADGQLERDRFTTGFHPNREYNLLLAAQLTQFLSGTRTEIAN